MIVMCLRYIMVPWAWCLLMDYHSCFFFKWILMSWCLNLNYDGMVSVDGLYWLIVCVRIMVAWCFLIEYSVQKSVGLL